MHLQIPHCLVNQESQATSRTQGLSWSLLHARQADDAQLIAVPQPPSSAVPADKTHSATTETYLGGIVCMAQHTSGSITSSHCPGISSQASVSTTDDYDGAPSFMQNPANDASSATSAHQAAPWPPHVEYQQPAPTSTGNTVYKTSDNCMDTYTILLVGGHEHDSPPPANASHSEMTSS